MPAVSWAGLYLANLIFWLYVLRGGGAERLEGTFTSGFLFTWFAPRWDEDGIRAFGWCTLFITTVWFILGLIWPIFRF